MITLSAESARVLGCLVEKSHTTPDQYPLSLNGLVTACNQSTNRWPVVAYDEGTVQTALDDLRAAELIRREKPSGSRAIKYSETITRVMKLDSAQIAVMAVLLLRGPQTPGELKARTERLHAFADLDAVHATLTALVDHEDGPQVAQLPREPGRKESRWRDCWQQSPSAPAAGGGSVSPAHPVVSSPGIGATAGVARVTDAVLVARVDRLEAEVAVLRARLDGLTGGDGH